MDRGGMKQAAARLAEDTGATIREAETVLRAAIGHHSTDKAEQATKAHCDDLSRTEYDRDQT